MTTLDKILLGCAIFILLFTVTMIVIFCIFQSVPDVLIDNIMNLFTGEAIITGLIWYAKRRFNLMDKDKDDEEIDE